MEQGSGGKIVKKKIICIDPEIGIIKIASKKIKDEWPKTGQYLKIYIKINFIGL
jgi:hypothetical protein